MDNNEVVCNLCEGSGHDTTGSGCNPTVGVSCVCVRCGGYGTIPTSCANSPSVTEDEVAQINYERVRNGLFAVEINGYHKTRVV